MTFEIEGERQATIGSIDREQAVRRRANTDQQGGTGTTFSASFSKVPVPWNSA